MGAVDRVDSIYELDEILDRGNIEFTGFDIFNDEGVPLFFYILDKFSYYEAINYFGDFDDISELINLKTRDGEDIVEYLHPAISIYRTDIWKFIFDNGYKGKITEFSLPYDKNDIWIEFFDKYKDFIDFSNLSNYDLLDLNNPKFLKYLKKPLVYQDINSLLYSDTLYKDALKQGLVPKDFNYEEGDVSMSYLAYCPFYSLFDERSDENVWKKKAQLMKSLGWSVDKAYKDIFDIRHRIHSLGISYNDVIKKLSEWTNTPLPEEYLGD